MTDPTTRVDAYRAARERVLARIDATPARARVAIPPACHAGRGLQDGRRGRAARRGRGRPRSARREPRPGGRRQGARGARRALAARRPAPVEQGAPGARGLRRRSRRSTRSSSGGGSTGSCPEVRPGARYPVLVQVNVDERPGQGGLRAGRPGRGPPGRCSSCRTSSVRGLMTVGRLTDGPGRGAPDVPRPARLCRSGSRARWPALGPELSMGMTDDFEVAVEEGATIVRVGRALFGERPAPGRARHA